MELITNILELCKTAKDKGNFVTVRYNGISLEMVHQESTNYEMIVTITVYDTANAKAMYLIENYLRGLIG
jgi:hypothetical protein